MRILRAATALVVAASALSFAVGCTGPFSSGSNDGQAAAAAFLDEIRAGRVEPAWRATTVEFKSLMGLASLRDYVRTHPALKGQAEFVEGPAIVNGKPGLADYVFRATAPPNTKGRGKTKAGASPTGPSTIRVTTAQEDGALKVERLAIE